MKTYRNLYATLCSYENLELAFKKARKRKTLKEDVIKFEIDLENNLKTLKNELENFTYRPIPLTIFTVRDPKTRRISASNFRDRVVHHAICNIIAPIFEKDFIFDSFANRRGKGTHPAIKRFEKFLKQVSYNGKILRPPRESEENVIIGYVLKADIRHYFDTINHEILLGIVQRKINDLNVIWLIKMILVNHKTSIPGKGMPLGNLTSQFFANVYLHELDLFAKHKLRAKYYVRYVDDFVILQNNEKILYEWKNEIDKFLREKLDIELHPEKSRIISLRKGTTLLGFRIFPYHRILKKNNAQRIWKRLKKLKFKYDTGKITRKEVIMILEGWLAYAKFANTYKFRKKVMAKFNELFGSVK